MGAATAIGTGLSVISGLGAASEKNRQAAAQKKAIENQNQVDQLNAQLQLLALNNQKAVNQVQQNLSSAAEQQAYLSRQAQLNIAQSQNELALGQAAVEADAAGKVAESQRYGAQTQALQQAVEGQTNIGQALTEALGASSGEQQQVIEQLRQLPERQRADAIAGLLDVASTRGGSNEALRMLTEVVDNNLGSKVARAVDAGANKAALARDSASARSAEVEATKRALEGQSNLQYNDASYQSRTAALDVQTAGQVASASFASQRTATEGAYNAGLLSRGVSDAATNASFAANEEVLRRGAQLSASTAATNAANVRGAGFFDYLNVAGTGYTTFTNLGGQLPTQQTRQTRGFLGDVTNVNYNAA